MPKEELFDKMLLKRQSDNSSSKFGMRVTATPENALEDFQP